MNYMDFLSGVEDAGEAQATMLLRTAAQISNRKLPLHQQRS